MKYVCLALTLLAEYLLIRVFKMLDNTDVLIIIFVSVLLIGMFITIYNKKVSKTIKNIGWGMLYGSISTIVLMVVFFLWLSYNPPR
jgi:hypothetical protein